MGVALANAAARAAALSLLLSWVSAGAAPPAPRAAIAITEFSADKILYAPGEPGVIRVGLGNAAEHAASGRLEVILTRELADVEILRDVSVQIAARGSETFEVPFIAGGRFGTEALATVEEGATRATARDYFGVAENFFEVAIGHPGGSSLHTGLGRFGDVPREARKARANFVELFFWAPDDWALLVSPLARWWSGQASYPEDEENLKRLIADCRRQGIRVIAYCSRNAGGPFGWELARKRPEWFLRNPLGQIDGVYDVEHLERWNDPAWRRTAAHPEWYRLHPDLRRMDALDWGIDQIADSVARYGWDAVRFDGHYTVPGDDSTSTRNMRRLKERVWRRHPRLRFGFNYGRAPEWLPGEGGRELREAMAGGGLYLQEGIKSWLHTTQRYESWRHYAENELRVAKRIQALGGSYHAIWGLGASPKQDFYKLVYGLIAGGHPFYGSHGELPGPIDWGAFMTRWSAMLWDPALGVVEAPERRFRVASERAEWRPFAQERIESARRKFVILHLVNPPPGDRIAETEMPPPLSRLTVGYAPEPGTEVARVALVRPETASETILRPVAGREGTLEVQVPRVEQWAMVVWEVGGRFSVPEPPPKSIDLPERGGNRAGAASETLLVVDPAEGASRALSAADELVIPLNRGSQNVGPALTTDPDSDAGTVQWREKGRRDGKAGMSWIGPLDPGRYEVSVRLKWTDPGGEPSPQHLIAHVYDGDWEEPREVAALVTPGHPDPPGGDRAIRLGDRGKYAYYPVRTLDKRKAGYIHVLLWLTAREPGEHTIYLDRVKVRTLERYTDREIEKGHPLPAKPAGLARPRGTKPERILLVKGMFCRPYAAGLALPFAERYRPPADHGELYGFDAVVLCDLDFARVELKTRKMLRDYVLDGGRLVFLGGPFTLGQGGVPGSFIDEVMPVDSAGPNEVAREEPPALLGPSRDSVYAERPAVFWRHRATPRTGATTLAFAGGLPIAVGARYGEGEVFVFTGTTLGEGDAGHRPFWQTRAWRDLLARMVAGR